MKFENNNNKALSHYVGRLHISYDVILLYKKIKSLNILLNKRFNSISPLSVCFRVPVPLFKWLYTTWSTFFIGTSNGLISTCLNYLKRFSSIFSSKDATQTRSHIWSLRILFYFFCVATRPFQYHHLNYPYFMFMCPF